MCPVLLCHTFPPWHIDLISTTVLDFFLNLCLVGLGIPLYCTVAVNVYPFLFEVQRAPPNGGISANNGTQRWGLPLSDTTVARSKAWKGGTAHLPLQRHTRTKLDGKVPQKTMRIRIIDIQKRHMCTLVYPLPYIFVAAIFVPRHNSVERRESTYSIRLFGRGQTIRIELYHVLI
jgi:hypothetical protein